MKQSTHSIYMGYDLPNRQLIVASVEVNQFGEPLFDYHELEQNGLIKRYESNDAHMMTDEQFIAYAESTIARWQQYGTTLQHSH